MERFLKILSNRYFVFSGIVIAFCLLLAFQLFSLQVINGQSNSETAAKVGMRLTTIVAPRGDILDTNNNPIATSRAGYSVVIARTGIKAADRDAMLLKLVNIFDKNGDSYDVDISKYLTFNPIDFGSDIKGDQSKIDKWKSDMNITTAQTPEEIFRYLRDNMFAISKSYSDEDAYKILTLRYALFIKGYSVTSPLAIANDVKKETIIAISENTDQFPGISIEASTIRQYNDATDASHVVGYVGNVSPDEYAAKKDVGYTLQDYIGKSGIELALEDKLRGTNGSQLASVNAKGDVIEQVKDVAPIPGSDVVLTIDNNLQKVASDALKLQIDTIRSQANYANNFGDCKVGSVVALDVNSGAVLAMASYPNYDPNIFVSNTADSRQKRADVLLDKLSPTLNRAVYGEYAPGSTFKPVTAVAGLESGDINQNTNIYSPKSIVEEGHTLTCLADHGTLNVVSALKVSCNVFFYKVGMMVGLDGINNYAQKLGFGQKTGIEIGDNQGFLADKSYKEVMNPGEGVWGLVDTAYTAIGQRFTKATPLQIADYCATLANGGKLYSPYIVKKIVQNNGDVVSTDAKYTATGISQKALDIIKKGMIEVSLSRPADFAKLWSQGIQVAVKTGTAEVGDENLGRSSNAIYMCYAPADNPKIAIAIVMERGVWGINSTPIATKILEQYFNTNVQVTPEPDSTSTQKVGIIQ
jgi:penicillin-binding protein 2